MPLHDLRNSQVGKAPKSTKRRDRVSLVPRLGHVGPVGKAGPRFSCFVEIAW